MYTEEKLLKTNCLPIENIRANPYQPRREMSSDGIEELCASIKQFGLMQPILVRQINGYDYELIAGERRLRACRLAGFLQIPAIVVKTGGTNSAVMALVENIQRENLGYLEEAEAFCSLISEHGLTQEELAAKLGKSQSAIANKIRILRLSPEIRKQLREYGLAERQARALLRLSDEKSRNKALNIIVSRGLNVLKTEELVDDMINKNGVCCEESPLKPLRAFNDLRIFSNAIKQAVDMMNRSGINASSQKKENDDYIEYTIKIPKKLKDIV